MTIGTSNRTALRYVAESVLGTTPATPALKGIRYIGESLNYNISNITSNEIREDRVTADLVQVSGEVAGDINWEFCYDAFDDLIEAVLCGTWGAPVSGVATLENGTTLRSFTFQKHFQDTTAAVYLTFKGCRMGSMDLNFETGQIVTGKFGVLGLNASTSASQIAGATFPAVTTNTPMNAVSNIIEIKEDGITSTQLFSKLSLSYNNSLRSQRAIASLGAVGIALGRIDLGGSIEAYFQDKTLLDKFIAATSFALTLKVRDVQNNTYEVIVPKAKFESGNVVAGGLDQDLMFSATWKGVYDSVTTSIFQVTRDATPVGP